MCSRSAGGRLVHWEQLPIIVAPSLDEGNYPCASSCATHRADGTPMLFYGHTPLPHPDGTRPPRQQWDSDTPGCDGMANQPSTEFCP